MWRHFGRKYRLEVEKSVMTELCRKYDIILEMQLLKVRHLFIYIFTASSVTV
jgi:hypothetical protein